MPLQLADLYAETTDVRVGLRHLTNMRPTQWSEFVSNPCGSGSTAIHLRIVILMDQTMTRIQRRSQTVPAPPSHRQRIRKGMKADHSDELPEASHHRHDDDRQTVVHEPSSPTIIEFIQQLT